MLDKVLGKRHLKVNMWIFIGLFIAMFISPYVKNPGVKFVVLSVVLITFVNALVIGYKFIKYYILYNKETE